MHGTRLACGALAGILAAAACPPAAAAPMWSHRESCLPVGGSVLYGCAAATVETSDAQADCAHRDMGGKTWEWTCRVTIRETLCAQGTLLVAQLESEPTGALEAESRGGALNCYVRETDVHFNPEHAGYAPRIAYRLCLFADVPGPCVEWLHDVGPMPRALAFHPSLEGVDGAAEYARWAAFWTAGYAQQVAQEPLYVP